jgi:curved DNA-binding protein CbpA
MENPMARPDQRTAYEVLEVREDASQIVIEAAFRALAGQFHPDRNREPAAARRMAELNRAYALIRSKDLRQVYDRLRPPVSPPPQAVPVDAPVEQPKRGSDVLDFGRYAGWSLRDLARHDPDYLRWLSRHSSGIRHRPRIDELLAAPPTQTASERMRNR